MQKLGFHIVKIIAYCVAYTPFPIAYAMSSLWYVLLYHVVRYRRKVVRDNLTHAFAQKSAKEIKSIEKQFYRNFTDLFVEACKMLNNNCEDLGRRVRYTNPELLQKLYNEHKSVAVVTGHSGNWEWLGKTLHLHTQHNIIAVYKKLSNPYFDKFFQQIRKKYTTDDEHIVEMNSTMRQLITMREKNNIVYLIADQSPRGIDTDYWTNFFSRDTAWFVGPEKIAKGLNYAVVFAQMKRCGRGRYEVTLQELTLTPKEEDDNQIMESFVRSLEHFIEENPDNWLWSHRRWKHQRSHSS